MQIQLKVPWFGQLNLGQRNMCGQACACMLVHAMTSHRPASARVVAQATGTDDGTFTSIGELLQILRYYGIEATNSTQATLAWIRAKLAEGKPVITLVAYTLLKAITGYNYDYAHFVVVIGIDDERGTITILDPLTRRHDIPTSVFETAISTPSKYSATGTNYPFQAVVPKTLTAEIETPMAKLAGVNLAPFSHANGMPNPDLLTGIKYARLPVNISNSRGGHGNLDWNQTLDVLMPYLKALIERNVTPVLIMLHQSYGEAVTYPHTGASAYNWSAMYSRPEEWTRFMQGERDLPGFLAFCEPVLRRLNTELSGRFIVQFWNEQDAPTGAVASVPIPAASYGAMYRDFYAMVKRVNSNLKCITGGHLGGAGDVVKYVKTAMIPQNDGIGFHPYTLGARAYPNLKQHDLEPALDLLRSGLPGYSLWITEACGYPLGVNYTQFYDAVKAFVAVTEARGLPCMIYPGGDGMHGMKGFWNNNVVNRDAQGRAPLDLLKGAAVSEPPTQPPPAPEYGEIQHTGEFVLVPDSTPLNVRNRPSTSGTSVIGSLTTGVAVTVYSARVIANGYTWCPVQYKSGSASVSGWMAIAGGAWSVSVLKRQLVKIT